MALFAKGQSGNLAGRPRGTPNKVTGEVRTLLLRALERAGGEDYLVQQAQVNPTAFLALLGKCIPSRVEGTAEAPVTIVVKRPW